MSYVPRRSSGSDRENLDAIREDGGSRERSGSPEPMRNSVDVNDFEYQLPQRGLTHPTVPQGLKVRSLSGGINPPRRSNGTAGKAKVGGDPTRRRKPPLSHRFFHRTQSPDSDRSYPGPKRHSTINTEVSASFEETAMWDHKTILSLGMYSDEVVKGGGGEGMTDAADAA